MKYKNIDLVYLFKMLNTMKTVLPTILLTMSQIVSLFLINPNLFIWSVRLVISIVGVSIVFWYLRKASKAFKNDSLHIVDLHNFLQNRLVKYYISKKVGNNIKINSIKNFYRFNIFEINYNINNVENILEIDSQILFKKMPDAMNLNDLNYMATVIRMELNPAACILNQLQDKK